MLKELNVIAPTLFHDDDRIIAYLKGQMPEGEAEKFLKELESNAELREEAVAIARLVKGLKEVGREKDRGVIDAFLASDKFDVENVVRETLGVPVQLEYQDYALPEIQSESSPVGVEEENVEEEKQVSAMSRRKRSYGKWLSVAASLVFIVWVGVEYGMYRTTTGLGEQYGSEFTSSSVVRGTDAQSEASRKLAKLFGNVKHNKNIGETIHELSLCWELSTMETYNDYTDCSAEIGWNLAIACLKDNDKDGARKVLQRLVKTTEDGSAINRKARELLGKL